MFPHKTKIVVHHIVLQLTNWNTNVMQVCGMSANTDSRVIYEVTDGRGHVGCLQTPIRANTDGRGHVIYEARGHPGVSKEAAVT